MSIAVLTALAALATSPAALAQVGAPGSPPLTELTLRTGGPLDPLQARQQLDTVDLALEVFPQTESIAGVATLAFTARAPLDRLLIDLDTNLPVSAIAIDGIALPRSAWSNPQGRLTIRLPRAIAPLATVTARITYAGRPHKATNAPWDGGFVWSQTPDGKPWVATAVQGEGCDLFWPCIDHPSGEPKTMAMHITVPPGLKAPGNGVLTGIDILGDGRTTWNWRARQPNSYAIALNIGPYELMSGEYRSRFGNVIRMEYWHLPATKAQAAALFAEFAPNLDFFEEVIGPYPFADEKLGVVETPHLGMEHQTINAYGNGYRQAPEGFDWLFNHEFAHEWFANQMTVADWDDYWLHEGYAQYMQPLYARWREGDARYMTMLDVSRNRITNRFPLVSGRSRPSEDVYGDANGPGIDIYMKGAWMLHTLRTLIGDAAFYEVTRRIVYGRADPRPGNFAPRFTTTAEYRQLVNSVTGRDLGWFFDVYLNEAALPELIATRNGDRLDLRWQVPGNRPFPMPVEVRVGDRTQSVAMTGGVGSIAAPAGTHVTLDPMARILKRSVAVERYQAWQSRTAAGAKQ